MASPWTGRCLLGSVAGLAPRVPLHLRSCRCCLISYFLPPNTHILPPSELILRCLPVQGPGRRVSTLAGTGHKRARGRDKAGVVRSRKRGSLGTTGRFSGVWGSTCPFRRPKGTGRGGGGTEEARIACALGSLAECRAPPGVHSPMGEAGANQMAAREARVIH